MTDSRGVALVGIGADHWSGTAHVPALATTPGVHLARLVTSNPESAQHAQGTWHVPASETLNDALNDDAVDIVTITVRVARHFEIAVAAIAAGKHVYCEWPLGADSIQAHALADRASRYSDRLHVAGLQGRLTPEVQGLAAAVAAGRLGRPVRANLHVQVPQALEPRPAHRAHLRRRSAAANVLSIQGGHAIDMLATILGPPGAVRFAEIWTAAKEFTVLETGERLPRDAPDNVVAHIELGRVPVTVQLSQTATRPGGYLEILGTEASVRITAPNQPQMSPLDVTITDLGAAPQPWLPDTGAGVDRQRRTRLDRAHPGYGVGLVYGQIAKAMAANKLDAATVATFADAAAMHDFIDAVQAAAAI